MGFQMNLAIRYLSGRKLRTFLTTLAIVFGVLVIFGMNTLLPAFLDAFQASALALSGQVDLTITSKAGEAFSVSIVDRVSDMEGVRTVSGSLKRNVNLPVDYFDHDPSVPDQIAALSLVGAVPDDIRSLASYNILQGRFLEDGDQAASLITESLADQAGVGLGDVLTLPSPTGLVDLPIVGILPQRLLPGNEEVLIPLSQAQEILGMPERINTIDVNFDTVDEARRAEIQGEIQGLLGESFTIGALQPGAEILTNIRTGQAILNLLGVLGLLMGGFIIFNTFRTVITERRRDFGMLRAVGASRRTITGLVLTEGMIQGVIGTAVGLLLGYLFGLLALNALEPLYRQFMNIEISSPVVTPGLVILSILLGVGITLLAGFLPARAAGRVTPLEALRPSLGEVALRRMTGLGFWVGVGFIVVSVLGLLTGRTGLIAVGSVLFVVGLILIAPALVNPIARLFGKFIALIFARNGTAQLAEGNLSRQPSRAAVTASTTLIAIAVVVMAGTILSSISIGFIGMLEKSLSSDFLLVPPSIAVWGTNVGAAPDLADEIRGIEGVDVVSTLRFAGTQINGVATSMLGIVPEDYVKTSGLTFSGGDPETAFREMESGNGLIINGVMATAAGLDLGDEISLITPAGAAIYKVVGIASDYLNAKITTGYISQANIAKDFGSSEDVFLQVNLAEGADFESARAAIQSAVQPYPQFKLVAGKDYVAQNIALFDAIFVGFYALVAFLSIPSLIAMINTLAIGVIERTREIGMLRAVGATRPQIRTVILTEALILSAIGTTFGLLAGIYLGYMAVMAFSAIGFPSSYVFPTNGVIAALIVGLAFGALAAILPARQASRMNVVEALRYE